MSDAWGGGPIRRSAPTTKYPYASRITHHASPQRHEHDHIHPITGGRRVLGVLGARVRDVGAAGGAAPAAAQVVGRPDEAAVALGGAVEVDLALLDAVQPDLGHAAVRTGRRDEGDPAAEEGVGRLGGGRR